MATLKIESQRVGMLNFFFTAIIAEVHPSGLCSCRTAPLKQKPGLNGPPTDSRCRKPDRKIGCRTSRGFQEVRNQLLAPVSS